MSGKNIIIAIFVLIGIILIINIFKFILNFFSNNRRYEEIKEVKEEVNKKVKPYLTSLEKKFEKENIKDKKFGEYVAEQFKDKIKNKNEKLVEKEICKCCDGYLNAECKEDYCLEGAGISCKK